MPTQVEEREEKKVYFAGLNDEENEKLNAEARLLSRRAETESSLFFRWLEAMYEVTRELGKGREEAGLRSLWKRGSGGAGI